jgi:hypothetical protein
MTGILSYSILVNASCLLNFCANWFVVEVRFEGDHGFVVSILMHSVLIIKTNEMHSFSDLFGKVLYMFWTGPPSIMRCISTQYTCKRYLSC